MNMLERLSDLRKNRKWSLQETADQLGIAKSTYAGYESGYREPSLHSLTQIADLFDTSVDFLLGTSNEDGNTLEMANLLKSPSHKLCIDGELLTPEEMLEFVAFVRAKRLLRTKGMEEGGSS